MNSKSFNVNNKVGIDDGFFQTFSCGGILYIQIKNENYRWVF
jgi:hypothetical protein